MDGLVGDRWEIARHAPGGTSRLAAERPFVSVDEDRWASCDGFDRFLSPVVRTPGAPYDASDA
jgi:hypothetical protein